MRRLSIQLVSAAGVCISAPAVAQDVAAQDEQASAASDAAMVDVIIVQARRRNEDVQDVPAVIDTVTAEDVGKLNLRNFTEVSTVVPGLQLTTESNGTGGNARLRGVNFDITASGNNPTVEFYFNDAPITAGVILQQMYDIGQIEVQRGPQGTLRGRAAPSGSITVGAKKPDLYSFGGMVNMTANDIGTLNFNGALNIPVIEGIAAIRVAGVWDENEGDRVRPISGAQDPFSRTKSGRISALVQPTDWLKLEGLYQRLERNARTYNQVASFSEVNPDARESPEYIATSDRLSIQEDPRFVRQVYDIFNWRAEASALGQVLIYQGQHYTQDIESTDNRDVGNFFPGDVLQYTVSNPRSTSHELRLQNDERLFDIFDYVVGYFDYYNEAPTILNNPTLVGIPTGPTQGTLLTVVQTDVGRTGDSKEVSFFGNLTAHFGQGTEISGGLRHIDYTSDNALIVNGNTIANDGQDAKEWIYAASIKHQFTPDFMIYASTGSSWRPGINVVGDFNIARSPLEDSFLNLPAETSKSYEIGMKSTLMGGRLRANLTGYHQKFKNYPYRVGGDGVYFVSTVALRDGVGNVIGTAQEVDQFNFVGAVPVEVNGVEGDISFDVTPRWNVGLVASYSLGKIKNGTIPCTDLDGDGVPDRVTDAPSLEDLQDAVGADNLSACQVNQRSGFQPLFSATLTSEYNFPVSDNVDGYVRGLFNFSGKSQTDPTNAFDDVGSYGLTNVYLGVRDPLGAWEVSLFAKNLFETEKALSRTNPLSTSYLIPTATGSTVSATYSSTYTGVSMTPPREFGINVRYAFGSR